MPIVDLTLLPAAEAGRICATASRAQRDLQRCAAAYPELFPTDTFISGLFSAVALASAFAAPWSNLDELKLANRAALWTFGLDRLIDIMAVSGEAARSIVTRCLDAVNGQGFDRSDQLVAFLFDIYTELSGQAGFEQLGARWREELARMLNGMCTERVWLGRGADGLPTLVEYEENSDSLAFAFVFATQLIGASGGQRLPDVDGLFAAVRCAQRALRLVNDLATAERELGTGDVNVLLLGVDPAVVEQRIRSHVESCRQALARAEPGQALACASVARHLEYNMAFYESSDYW